MIQTGYIISFVLLITIRYAMGIKVEVKYVTSVFQIHRLFQAHVNDTSKQWNVYSYKQALGQGESHLKKINSILYIWSVYKGKFILKILYVL